METQATLQFKIADLFFVSGTSWINLNGFWNVDASHDACDRCVLMMLSLLSVHFFLQEPSPSWVPGKSLDQRNCGCERSHQPSAKFLTLRNRLQLLWDDLATYAPYYLLLGSACLRFVVWLGTLPQSYERLVLGSWLFDFVPCSDEWTFFFSLPSFIESFK